jgi:hypothetical protein
MAGFEVTPEAELVEKSSASIEPLPSQADWRNRRANVEHYEESDVSGVAN